MCCHGSHAGQRHSALPSLRDILQDLLAYKWPWNSFHPSWQPSETLGLICNKYSKILSPGSRLTFLKVILNPICVISLNLLKLFAFALQPTQRILSCEEKKKKKDEMVLFCQLSTLAAACNLFCSTLLLQPDWFLKSYLQNSLAFQNSFLVLIFHRTLLFTHLSILWISKALCLLLHNSWCGVFVPCFPILLSGFFFKSLLSSI